MADLPLVRHAAHAPFAYRDARVVRSGEFLAEVAQLAQRLPQRRYVVNLCADRLRFTAGFAASLLRGQVSLMPPSHTADVLARLAREYPDLYCLTDGGSEHPGFETLQYPCASPRGDLPYAIPAVPEERVAAIVFTSGSTGDPMPHPKHWGDLVASAMAELECLGLQQLPGLRLLGTVPPQHMYGLESTVLMALQGGLALHSGRPFFPADICAELEALPRPRGLVTTPVHLRALLAESGALPPLDFMLCATAALSPQLAAHAEARFAAPLQEIYGCTETGQLASRRPSATPEWQLFPGMAMRQDEKGTWVRGGHARAEVLLSDVIELRGPGRFVLHGRTADLVNVAGKRTSLASLNHHLNSIPGVRDGEFVVPAGDGEGVTRLAAFVVAPGLTSETILAALRERIDPAFLPRPLCRVEALPRNETGKLPRARLDALLAKADS
jgi:acyl-coenzyme A synthetase/AMP-(fatty) acid ligase